MRITQNNRNFVSITWSQRCHVVKFSRVSNGYRSAKYERNSKYTFWETNRYNQTFFINLKAIKFTVWLNFKLRRINLLFAISSIKKLQFWLKKRISKISTVLFFENVQHVKSLVRYQHQQLSKLQSKKEKNQKLSSIFNLFMELF